MSKIGQLEDELRAVETAFAATMAARDHAAFVSFLSEDVIFFAGDTPLRGQEAVAEAWSPFFTEKDAPFSWTPTVVTVLESGMLGLTSGPVRSPAGEEIGVFNSIWRRSSTGEWKIVFDRGCSRKG